VDEIDNLFIRLLQITFQGKFFVFSFSDPSLICDLRIFGFILQNSNLNLLFWVFVWSGLDVFRFLIIIKRKEKLLEGHHFLLLTCQSFGLENSQRQDQAH